MCFQRINKVIKSTVRVKEALLSINEVGEKRTVGQKLDDSYLGQFKFLESLV